jgi:hypothetical protein
MRIFTKKAFGFVNPDLSKEVNGAREVVRTTPNTFQDVPDWVANDDMFKWGKDDGDIEVIQVDVAVAAKEAKAPAADAGKAADNTDKPAGWVAPAADAGKGK